MLAAMANGVDISWLHEGYVLEMGRVGLQAMTPQGLRLGFWEGIIDFFPGDDIPETDADVVIGGGMVEIGEQVYFTETYGAVQLRINRRRVRYWVD